MKGDFTRFTFDPRQHYTQVRKQQGRVDLDADWNEYLDIQSYLAETSTLDIIGRSGAPKIGGGFLVKAVTPDGQDFSLTAGRMYVDGILCQLEAAATYLGQPDDPAPTSLEPEDGRKDLVFLDVWKRHLTALEAPEIREVALGGPDTTTRVQTVCQVKVLADVDDWQCGEVLPNHPDLLPALEARGRLTAYVNPAEPPESICDVPSSGGYRGLENRLYRVEIHAAGDINSATFKWSRDNGAVVLAIEAFDSGDPTKVTLKSLGKDLVLGVSEQDWVEVLGDTTELHQQPGTLAKIEDLDEADREIKLSADVSPHSAESHPKVRRWDQKSAAIPVSSSEIELEDGIKIKFSDGAFQSGDYWVFAARTAQANIERLTEAPPAGVEHQYTALAELSWKQTTSPSGKETWSAEIKDCRLPFPPLTAICAEDVCYDDSNCDTLQAETVQEAIDILCQQRNLNFHNKHLHGWGVVCGLQVICGADDPEQVGDRRNVLVKPGYALDCEGYDLILDQAQTVKVLDLVDDWDRKHPNDPLLKEGENGRSGKLDLIIKRGADGQPRLSLRRHEKKDEGLQALLKGTLLMDFIQECIVEPLEEIKERLLDPEGQYQPKGLVGVERLQIVTLLNLLIQLLKPTYGRHVYLSQFEHQLLKDLYFDLRAILQSKTFCGMFDDAPEFPDYPFPEHRMNTIFGQQVYKRLRIHPEERLAFGIGYNNKISVFDLKSEVLTKELEFPGGEGIIVQDVAFLAKGQRLYVIASSQGADTLFGVTSIAGDYHNWDVSALCDLRLVTMLAGPGEENQKLYAIALGKGLYSIDPESDVIKPKLVHSHSFYASGHLVMDKQRELVFATAHQQTGQANMGLYNQVLGFDLGSSGDQAIRTYAMGELKGRDDIAVADFGDQSHLFVVCNPLPDTSPKTKHLLLYQVSTGEQVKSAIDLEENTVIRLQALPGLPYLAVSFEDNYWVRLLNLNPEHDEIGLVDDYHLPVQISPVDMAVATRIPLPEMPARGARRPKTAARFYALNAFSGTLTSLPLNYLAPDKDPGVTPPTGSSTYLNQLIVYRAGILQAYVGLAGHLLQSLKDCFCQRFLVDCPTCEEDDDVFLGTLTIKADEVYTICNFSHRKYVHSFPTAEYWLSLVPIIPLFDRLFEQFCCLLLPHIFSDYQQTEKRGLTWSGERLRQIMVFIQQAGAQRFVNHATHKTRVTQMVVGDWIRRMLTSSLMPPEKMTTGQDVIGKKVEEANENLTANEIEITEVQDYDATQAVKSLHQIRMAPSEIPAGSKVTLYQESGVVRYYSLAEEEPQGFRQLRHEIESQRAELAAIKEVQLRELDIAPQKAEVESMKIKLEEMQTSLVSKDTELAELRQQVVALQQRSSTGIETAEPVARSEVEAELKELRALRDEMRRFMSGSGNQE